MQLSFVACLSGELKPIFLLLDAPADQKNIGDDDTGNQWRSTALSRVEPACHVVGHA
jgi:hypothetical protein